MTRRTAITDAAIETLAAHGMHGLTHRAVDRAAALPEGSTSYYFRTRAALVEATLERLADLSQAELRAVPGNSRDAFADAAAALLYQWMTTGRNRQLARYELTLEATRRPELCERLAQMSTALRDVVADRLDAAGMTLSRERVDSLVAMFDGLLFDQIAGPGKRQATVEHLNSTVRALLSTISG